MNGSTPKRMYVLENVRDFVSLHSLQAGSTLSFFYAPDNRLVRSGSPRIPATHDDAHPRLECAAVAMCEVQETSAWHGSAEALCKMR